MDEADIIVELKMLARALELREAVDAEDRRTDQITSLCRLMDDYPPAFSAARDAALAEVDKVVEKHRASLVASGLFS